MSVSTFAYTRTHTAAFIADHMRNQLVRIIQAAGLSPIALVDDWEVLGNAARRWLEAGYLTGLTIEFHKPGSSKLELRWDFEIDYTGNGVDNDMWVDKNHLRRTIDKAGQPPSGCNYTILLSTRPGRPNVQGMNSANFRSTAGLVSRATGTAIATHDITAGLNYWRPQ